MTPIVPKSDESLIKVMNSETSGGMIRHIA